MTRIVHVTSDDKFQKVAMLAKEIWTAYFTPIIGEGQVAYMLRHIQSLEAIKKQTAEGYQYHLINDGDFPVGYLSIKTDQGKLLLSKLYLQGHHRGKGIGRTALKFIESYARQENLHTIWLTVNKGNLGAIAAYQKWGFVISGELVTDIGGGYVMDDFRMERQV